MQDPDYKKSDNKYILPEYYSIYFYSVPYKFYKEFVNWPVSMEHIITDIRFQRSAIRKKMKNLLYAFGILELLLFLLIHPAESLACARAGMTLWLNTLIPTLLPFIILTGILTRMDIIQELLSPFERCFRIALGVSSWGGYIFILGMLCGYPLGAKLASDLYVSNRISKKEALYLTTFCNNPSPAFVITYLSKFCLKDTVPAAMIFFSIFFTDLVCMLFFRFVVYKNTFSDCPVPAGSDKETSNITSNENLLDVSIMNGFETIARLGGYILLFSILAGCIRYYHLFPAFWQYMLLGFTEITTGLSFLAASGLPSVMCISLSVAATASGGLCILAQTRSILHRDLSLIPYIVSKCISAILATGIIYCFLSYM